MSLIKHSSKKLISKILECDSITILPLLLGENSKYNLMNLHCFDLYQILVVRSQDLLNLSDLCTLDSIGLNISPFENFSTPGILRNSPTHVNQQVLSRKGRSIISSGTLLLQSVALLSEEKFKERSSTAEHTKIKVIDLNEDTNYKWDNYLLDAYPIEEKCKPLTEPAHVEQHHIQPTEEYYVVPAASLLLDQHSSVQESERSNGTISERVSCFNTTVRKLKVATIIVPGKWVSDSRIVAMISHLDPRDILAVDSGYVMLLQTYVQIKQMSIHAEYLENHFSRRFNTALRRLTTFCKVIIRLTNSALY